MRDITVAILAKDKGYCLSFYLHCLLQQTYPKDKMILYIRTNDNSDNTQEILEEFIQVHGSKYKHIYYDPTSIDPDLSGYENHSWDLFRFKVMSKIRQESIDFAKRYKTDYFVADCDNFLERGVLKRLWDIRSFGVVAPLLSMERKVRYSNMHNQSCALGYYQPNKEYHRLVSPPRKGVYEVSTVHCTYLIRNDLLDDVTYEDNSTRAEYVILSDAFRRKNIPQLIDDRQFNGFLFIDTDSHFNMPFYEFVQQEWFEEYLDMAKNIS